MVSLDPANKQRDDDCQGVIPAPLYNVIPVPIHWDPDWTLSW
ncbi:hypothetical protein [Wolbachia endosymbiont (group A) of Portevinia maculata]